MLLLKNYSGEISKVVINVAWCVKSKFWMLSGSFICQQGNVLKTTLITFNQVLFFVPVPNQKVHFHHFFDIVFVFICLRLKLIRRVVSIIVIDYCHIKLWSSLWINRPAIQFQLSPWLVYSLISLRS